MCPSALSAPLRAADISLGYRRSVLVLWPERNDFSIRYDSSTGAERACEILCASTSLVPTPEEAKLAEHVVRRASRWDSEKVLASVCPAAFRWKDAALWVRAVTQCGAQRSIAALGEQAIFGAVLAFPFKDIRPVYAPSRTRIDAHAHVLPVA